MPSYLCTCQKRIDYTSIPADASYHLVADADAQVDYDLITYNTSWDKSIDVLRCPSCDRLWVFWDGGGEQPTQYKCEGVDERD